MNVAQWQEHCQLQVARQARTSTIRVSGFSHDSKRATIRSWRESEIVSAKGLNPAVPDAVQQPLGCDATDIVEATD